MSGYMSKILGLLLYVINIYYFDGVNAAPGKNAIVTCPFQPGAWNKVISGKWQALINDDKYENVNTSQLTIKNVGITDSGDYSCNSLHEGYRINLNVIVVTSNSIVLTCPYDRTDYVWHRYTQNNWITLFANDSKYGNVNSDKLTIFNVDAVDHGQYNCTRDIIKAVIFLYVIVTPLNVELNQNYLAIIGGNVTLDCIVTGYPIASDIRWTDGQGTKLNGTRYSGGSLSSPPLTIHKVTESDTGQYICLATNTAGTNHRSTHLETGYTPYAEVARKQYALKTGDNVTIECKVMYADAVQWYKNGTILSADTKYNFIAIQNKYLFIYNVSTTDRDRYECRVTNKFGNYSDKTLIKIVDTVIPISSYEKVANESVILQCLIYDATEVKWRFNDEYITTETGRYSGGSITEPSLTITKLNRDDTGTYQCESLLESVSSVGSGIKLNIMDKPLVKSNEDNVIAINGKVTIIQCSFDSYPIPTGISWMKNGNIVNVEDRAKYNGSTVKIPSLTIYNVDYSDSGTYVCVVENRIGRSSGKPVKLVVQVADPLKSSSIVGPVAGGASGGIVAVVLIIVAVFIYTKRRNTPRTKKDRRGNTKLQKDESLHRHEAKNDGMYINIGHENLVSARETDDDVPVTSSVQKNNYDEKNTYYNVDDIKTVVQVKDLKAYIESKEANDGLKEDYKKIPYGILHPTTKAELKENMPKNRFKTTFPYDHTRVILETVHGISNSDYVNANYVDGFIKEKCYIASQGPLKQTLQDHWRMIWQNNTRKIVMLTNLIEGLKTKCERYWPIGGEQMRLDNMVLTLESEKERAAYITREISVEDKKTNEKRYVIQYHFTSWPDHGTPDPLYIVLFHKHFMNDQNKVQGGPVLVHCSAGIGRTGTFIALDALLEEGRSTGNVDIVKFVKKMRYSRMNMIQTADQYVCLHHAMLEAFTMEDTSISKEKFGPFWREIQSDKRPVNLQRLNEEFRKLNIKKFEHGDHECQDATNTENIDKNRNKSVLPMDNNRVFLVSFEKGRSNYINAVQVPSYTKFVGYITTQLPLPDTKIDFWTMIRDQHSSTIVLILNDLQEADFVYAVSDDSFTCGPFSVKIKRKEKNENNITEATLVMTKKHEKPREIALYQTICKDRPNPQDLCRLDNLLSTRISMSSDPVTVVSCDGAKNCGLFCTFINAVSSMQIDAKADVFQLARLLQLRRPEFFSNYEEYRLVYEALNFYLESTNVYAN